MTEQDYKQELESGLCLDKIRCSSLNSKLKISLPTMDCTTYNSNNNKDKTKHYLQFHGTTASSCLKRIVHEHDFE
jgi:hypothetical protein